jgi:hypothetical protein
MFKGIEPDIAILVLKDVAVEAMSKSSICWDVENPIYFYSKRQVLLQQ